MSGKMALPRMELKRETNEERARSIRGSDAKSTHFLPCILENLLHNADNFIWHWYLKMQIRFFL